MAEVRHIRPLHQFDQRATYLLLIQPQKIPHLVYIQEGKYYALTYKERLIGRDFRPYLHRLLRLGKALLFLELTVRSTRLAAVFEQYSTVDTAAISCFVPIKQIVLPQSTAQMVFELVPELYENKLIRNSWHVNLSPHLNEDGHFALSTYSREALFSYIASLKNASTQRR